MRHFKYLNLNKIHIIILGILTTATLLSIIFFQNTLSTSIDKHTIKLIPQSQGINPLQYIFQHKSYIEGDKDSKFNRPTLKKTLEMKKEDSSLANALKILKLQYDKMKLEYLKNNDLYATDQYEMNILYYATLFSDVKMIQMLFDDSIDLNRDEIGIQSLFFIFANNLFRNANTQTELNTIVSKNNTMLQMFIEYGVDINTIAFKDNPMLDKFTPLTLASRFNNNEAIKVLLNNGAEIDGRTESGKTLLMDIIQFKDTSMINYLIENGANTDLEDYNGKSVSHYSYETGDLNLIKLIDSKDTNIFKITDDGTTSLMLVAKHGDEETLQYFIDKGLSINDINSDDYSALLYAIKGANLEGVKYLLANNADIVTQRHLLGLAANGEYGDLTESRRVKVSYEMMEYVYNLNETDINHVNKVGATALRNAAAANNIEAVKFLIDKGANPNIIDNDGFTPLSAAQYFHYEDIIALLKEYKYSE